MSWLPDHIREKRMNWQLVFFFPLLFCATGVLAVPGVYERKLILGSHQPLTGAASQFAMIGPSTDAYFQYVNAQGGVHGRAIEYRYLDDRFQPERTLEVARQLLFQEPVFLMLNGLGTETHQTIYPALLTLRIPDFFIGSAASQWTKPVIPSVFGFYPTAAVEGNVLGKYLLKYFAQKQVVIWYQKAAPTMQIMKQITALLEQQNPPVFTMSYAAYSPENLAKDIAHIKNIAPQVVVVLGEPEQVLQFLRQSSQQGIKAEILLSHEMADARLVEWLEPAILENVSVLVTHPLALETNHPGIKLHQVILSAYAPQLKMDRWSIYGHAVAELMTEILQRSGRYLNRQNVIAAAETLNHWQGLMSPPVTLNAENHLAITSLRLARIRSGKVHFLSDWIDGR